jgi:NTP pyrophosphatase (non-canonical NTP hydrolase)
MSRPKRKRAAGTLDRHVRPIIDRAETNLRKWGKQNWTTLGLAISEEAGEIAQAILQSRHENGDPDRIRREAIDLGALCLQLIDTFPPERKR